ncbi:cell wall-binding repeat-containing protein [Herbiconiux solani]|uniref:cell wall-binding repeat-containing protein n=1 Tax=Herbiconiux solani TaxID=661329 RepID=UPI000A0088C0|nr:cell wall-binding repeat-containing protein [Herbiconiux solani]
MTSSALRRLPLAGLAAAVLLAGVAVAPAGASATEAPRRITFDRLHELSYGSDAVGPVVVDPATDRAYVTTRDEGRVDAFDISGGAMTSLATITDDIDRPVAAALNGRTHVLVVVDAAASQMVRLVDVNPASATVNRVLRSIPTGGMGAVDVGVDASTNTAYVVNQGSDNTTVVDLATGATRLVATGWSPVSVSVDEVGHRAFVTSTRRQEVTVVRADGSSVVFPLDAGAGASAISGGLLYLGMQVSGARRVETYDLDTMDLVGSSPLLPDVPVDIAIDNSRRVVYLALPSAVQTLRVDTLVPDTVQPLSAQNSGVAVHPVTHRLFVSWLDSPRNSHLALYDIHASPVPSADRIGGADRYAVAASASADTFSSGVPVAYVASGEKFPDALSGSAAAGARGGPVLLVMNDSVPASTAAELKRLKPRSIVLLGGLASVTAGVEATLRTFSPTVSRIAGVDRYAVSAAVSEAAFSRGAPVAFLASGEVFPDALSASAAAGRAGSPVLLVQKDAVPAAILAELRRLGALKVVVLGGANTIAESVLTTLRSEFVTERIDGSDRFAVSASVASSTFPHGAYTVYVASGEVFPDALSGAAAAVAHSAPVLLVNRDSIPPAVSTALDGLKPYRIVVLGGEATVSDAVLAALESKLTAY